MTEKEIEQKLINEVKKRRGKAWKFISPGTNGVPDRLVLLQKGRLAFVELKAPGKVMRPQQIKRARELKELGFLVYCIDDSEKIGDVLDEISTS